MLSPLRPFLPFGTLVTLVAVAFSSYVAIDDDLRTLVWNKWKDEVPYEFPGGERHISISIDGEEAEIDTP